MSTRYDQLREACIAFHQSHPEVWAAFERLTFDRIRRGFRHYSTNAIFEAIRWESDEPGGEGESTFRLNNNFRSFYARAFMRRYPEHDGFFRVRRQTSEDRVASRLPELGPRDFPYQQGGRLNG